MSPIVTLLTRAIDVGLAVAEIIPWARRTAPELMTSPLPDAAGDMYEARARAQIRDAREVAGRLWASGDLRGAAYRELLRALDGEASS